LVDFCKTAVWPDANKYFVVKIFKAYVGPFVRNKRKLMKRKGVVLLRKICTSQSCGILNFCYLQGPGITS
jgi:hypothetical protein